MNFYSKSATGNSFFAREDILAVLLKCAKDIREGYRHNVAVIGRGLIGKSSLLLHFLGIIKEDRGLIPVYINARGLNFAEFVDNFITALLHHSLKDVKGLKKDADTAYLRKSANSIFPKTCDFIKKIKASLEDGNLDDAYSDIWDLCVVLNAESGSFPVVVLDEFDQLSRFPVKKPFQILGQKIMVQQRTLFILSSSSTITAKEILSEKLSLLFGGFQIIDIEPFTPQQATILVEQQAKGMEMPDDLKDFIVVFTGGHPFYLKSIIEGLNLAREYDAERMSPKDLSLIIARLLFHPSGLINRFFSDLIEKLNADIPAVTVLEILNALLANSKVADIAKRYRISPASFNRLLNNLLEVGVLSKSGPLYTITDGVFRMWIQIRAKPRRLYFDFMPQEGETAYGREIEESIRCFKSDRRKGLDDKVIELVTSFKGGLFFVDQRMRLLPRLNYIHSQKIDPNNTFIITQGKRKWLFVVSTSNISEEDVYKILDEIKRLKYDNAKTILISANEIDAAAKLLAKQKRVWVWSRDDLNRLFQFYKGYNALIA